MSSIPDQFSPPGADVLTVQLDWTSSGTGWGFNGSLAVLAAVPEPGTATLVAFGLLVLARCRRAVRR